MFSSRSLLIFCVCPRSFNQALLLSTRWMFGRVNRMVVIGRFGAFFGRRRLVADADTGWSSAARTDATGCSAHGEASALVKLAVWSAVVPQRVRAIGHCLQQRSMRYTSDSSLVPARSHSLWQLKLASGCKTLASRTREEPLWASLRISRSPPMARCDACLSARLLSLSRAACDLCMYAGSRLTSPFYGIGERWMGSSA